VGAALTTLIVSAILIAVAEGYTEEKMASVIEEPVDRYYAVAIEAWLGVVLAAGFAVFANNLAVVLLEKSLFALP
jgi:hypothetical protein